MTVINWIQNHWGVFATILFLISELLGESTRFKNNSVFGTIRDFFKGEAKKAEPEIIKALEK